MSANRYEDNELTRLALAELSIKTLKESLERIEGNMNNGFSEINSRFNDVNKKIDDSYRLLTIKIDDLSSGVNNRLWRNFYFMIGGFAGLFAMMGHGFKWF